MIERKFEVVEGGAPKDGSDFGGPEDPMLEARVARLEDDVREIRADVREIKRDIRDLGDRVGRMEVGLAKLTTKIDALPTIWTFVGALVGTVLAACALTAGIAALFLNAGQ